MDGGRVFRSLLAFFLPYVKATVVSPNRSFIAVLFFVLGLTTGNPSLFLIAVFVYVMASNEMRGVLGKAGDKGLNELTSPRCPSPHPVLSISNSTTLLLAQDSRPRRHLKTWKSQTDCNWHNLLV